jgi:hypothetical protein
MKVRKIKVDIEEFSLGISDQLNIRLLAFSKGCVVLNMICSEISNFYSKNEVYSPWSMVCNEIDIPGFL